MSYGTCNTCGSDDCEGYDACTIRSLRAEVERLRAERRVLAERVREACAESLEAMPCSCNERVRVLDLDAMLEEP